MSELMLEVSHDYWLVAASLAVALMSGFTGLSLTRGISQLGVTQRKITIVLAAISLGGGIWSMHFIAMLGMQLPVLFYYDPLITLSSALIAILVVGVGLLILHFRRRTPTTIALAGATVGTGILAMHYVGMSGIQLCVPVYTPLGIICAVIASITLSIGAFWLAYDNRARRNIVLGTLGFGVAVFAVHFIAMYGTSFRLIEGGSAPDTLIDNDTLAFIVALGSFVICGSFLLNTATFLPSNVDEAVNADRAVLATSPELEGPSPLPDPPVEQEVSVSHQVPFERDGRTFFLHYEEITAVRAEGHYTILYHQDEKLFCPWSISQAIKRLPESHFIRAHRSYLINPAHVSSFERNKDNGICYFADCAALDKVPVSRSRLPEVREVLGLA